MEFIQGMSSKGCVITARGKYTDQQYLAQGSVLFSAGSTSGITYYQKAIEEGYNGNWDVAPISHTTNEPVLNLYGGGLIMGNTGDANRMVAAYQWMKYFQILKIQRYGQLRVVTVLLELHLQIIL